MEQEKKTVLSNELSLTEEASKELLEITTNIELIESKLKSYAELEKSYDEFRKKLFDAMTKYGVSKYISNGNIQFTLVSASPDKTEIVLKFNEEKFKAEKPELYKKFVERVEKTTKGKTSYLRITLPKGDE